MQSKIVKAIKTDHSLSNGGVYKQSFNINGNITVEEFQ